MDMRDFLVLVEGYLTTLEPDSPVALTEAAEAAPTKPMNGFYIDAQGQTINPYFLIEGDDQTRPSILVEMADEEFRASWEETPPLGALKALSALIESQDEFEAYYIGSMIYPLRQQACAALASLTRGAER